MIRIFPAPSAYQEYMALRTEEPLRVVEVVREIIGRVRAEGDAALKDYTAQFDKVTLENFRVPQEKIENAVAYLDPAIKDVWIQAIENVEVFHRRQKEDSSLEFFPDGSVLGWKVSPIDRAGVYIPGGRAVYPSSLIMNAVPAQIAGVPRLVVVSPPGPDGLPHQDILAVAALLNLDEVYSIGGAQAIAALAYGTETIPRVFMITGPGNQYVAEAKRQVYGEVGIDSIAGPSEILVLCDMEIDTEYLVRDLLSQAEHDPEARAVLVTTNPEQAEAVKARLEALVPTLPKREIIEASLKGGSGIILVKNLAEGIEMVNQVAPEHLEVLTEDPFSLLGEIRNAGAIFLGPNTPEPVGDYFAGPNHTLPTGGRATFSSPLGVEHFVKKSSVLSYSKARLKAEGNAIARFAEREDLPAHAAAIKVRTK